jgi:SAM-dependent methyltransferase
MDRSHVDFTGSFADVYDRYLVPMDFAPYALRLAERVNETAPRRVLETAAGTGVVTRELARILPSDVSITATDLNEPMIALAQSKLGSERILWQQADALNLPFGDTVFDVVVCQFGVMFFPDKQRGFQEVLRVLRPGGHFLFNVWDSFEANIKSPLRIAARVVGAILDCEPVSLLAPPYHNAAVIRSDLAAAGFTDIQVDTISEPSRAASAHEASTIVCHGSRLRTAIDATDPSRLEEITDTVAEALRSRFGTGMVEGATQALMVAAQRSVSQTRAEDGRVPTPGYGAK